MAYAGQALGRGRETRPGAWIWCPALGEGRRLGCPPSWQAQGLARPDRTHDWPRSRTDQGLNPLLMPLLEVVWTGAQGHREVGVSLPKLAEAGQPISRAKIGVSIGALGTGERPLIQPGWPPRSPHLGLGQGHQPERPGSKVCAVCRGVSQIWSSKAG